MKIMSTPAPSLNKVSVESGDLREVPFARIFYRLFEERATGHLYLRDKPATAGGKLIKRVTVVEGEKFAVQGGSKKETLPEILLAEKKISPEQYQSLVKESGGDYGKMEQKIKSGAVIPAAELPELISFQLELKLKMLFAMLAGAYEFKPQTRDQLLAKEVVLPLSPPKFLREAVAEFYPLARIKKEFPGIERKIMSRSTSFKECLEQFGLAPNLLRWLRTLPESFSWQSLEKGAPLKQEELYKLLLAFYFAELITLPEKEADFPIGRAYLEEEKPGVKKPVEAVKPAATEPVKPAETKLPIEEMLDKEMSDQELLEEIEKLLTLALKAAQMKEANYFDLLGVQEQTPIPKVKQIYYKFARKFHPDSRPDLFQGEVKEMVEDLFSHLTRAYNELTDPALRPEYIKQIKSQISDADKDLGQRALEAEMEFLKASVVMKRGAWAEALGLLERAALLQPDVPEFQLYLGWARYKTKNTSEQQIKNLIKNLLPKLEKNLEARGDANLFLGLLAKAEGLTSEAINYFEEALKFKPDELQAKRELQILYRRKDQTPPPGKKGGLFGKK